VLNKLKEKERTQIINALRAGVVPTIGLRHIQVGRAQEVAEIVKDLDHIGNGGATIRFVSGGFGAGKSFFLTLTKLMAHEKRLLVLNADITTERILCSSDGKARGLLTELLKNMSHRSKSEGGGLKSLIETWISNFTQQNSNPTENDFYKALSPLSHLPLCQGFATVLSKYLKAFKEDDLAGTEKCLKWFRAEYENKTEAKNELGVSRIIEDGDLYDVLKIYAGFSKLSGFGGLLIAIDELAVLVRQRSPQRSKNYETLLTIINDCLQGNVENIGFIFGATAEAIENKERGLYSYGALETRLSPNKFANGTIKDLTGPVLGLSPLSKEELFVLLTRLRDIHSNFDATKHVLPDNGVQGFFAHIFSRMGAEAHLNPRDVIKEYLGLLTILENNPEKKWSDLLPNIKIQHSTDENSDLVKLQVE
jgi:hypothetical protein